MESRYLLSGGALDTTFTNNQNMPAGVAEISANNGAWTKAPVIQSDGKMLVAGGTISGGFTRMMVLRYNADGTPDNTFGVSGVVTLPFGTTYSAVEGMAVQPDGKILVGGYTDWLPSGATMYSSNFALARLTTTGALDTTFGGGTGTATTDFGQNQSSASSLLLQPDGKIVLVGTTYNRSAPDSNNSDVALARFNGDGSLDTTFGTGGHTTTDINGQNDQVNAAALQSDGKIVLVGANGYASYSSLEVARYTASGNLDTSFGSTGYITTILGATTKATATSVAIAPTGKIVVGGARDTLGFVARFDPTTAALDTTFTTATTSGYVTTDLVPGSQTVTGLGVQADNKVLVTGMSRFDGTYVNIGVERFTAVGDVDTGFNSTGTVPGVAVVKWITGNRQYGQGGLTIQSDGKVLLSASDNDSNEVTLSRFTLADAPTASAGGPYSINEASTGALNGSASIDPDGNPLTYQWDLNYNGSTFNPTASGPSPIYDATHIPGTSTHTVALRVVDLLGMPSGNTSTATVTVNHVNPTVAMPATMTVSQGPVTLSATIGDDGLHDPFTYRWHVTTSNGTAVPDSTSAVYSIASLDRGTYTVTLTATDASGATGSATTAITAMKVNPTVSVTGPATPNRDATTTWNFSATGPGTTSGFEPITGWTINWGDKKYDGSSYIETFSGSLATATHIFSSAGTYTLTATASDRDGTYTATKTVTVATGDAGDLAYGKLVGGSSGTGAANAVDGNPTTVWTSAAADTGQWFMLDLGGMTDINRVKLTWGNNSVATFKLRASNDSMTWRDMYTPFTSTGSLDDLQNLYTSTRYLLLQPLSARSGATNYQLASFEVYGGSNLAYGLPAGQVIASGGTGSSNAVDADGTTMWTTASGGSQFVILNLGEAVAVNDVKVIFGNNFAATYHIAVGNDSINWDAASTASFTGHAGFNDAAVQGSGRYVLLSLDSTAAGAANYQIADIAVYGSNNLAVTRQLSVLPATYSTTALLTALGSNPTNATDGNASTAWTSLTDITHLTQPSITVDLGDVFNVTHVNVNWANDYASAYTIATSNDNLTWTTAVNVTGAGGSIDSQTYADGRYVRLTCTGYGPTDKFSISELQAFGNANLADVKGAVSTYSGTNYATNVTDEDLSTQWTSQSNASNQWLMIDLGTNVTITAVNINWASNYAGTFRFYTSSDGAHWTTPALSSGGNSLFSGTPGSQQIAGLSLLGLPATARFLQLSCVSYAPGQNSFGILNMEVYGHA